MQCISYKILPFLEKTENRRSNQGILCLVNTGQVKWVSGGILIIFSQIDTKSKLPIRLVHQDHVWWVRAIEKP